MYAINHKQERFSKLSIKKVFFIKSKIFEKKENKIGSSDTAPFFTPLDCRKNGIKRSSAPITMILFVLWHCLRRQIEVTPSVREMQGDVRRKTDGQRQEDARPN